MKILIIFALCLFALAKCDEGDVLIPADEAKEIQEHLVAYSYLVDYFKYLATGGRPEEQRESEGCLPEGSACKPFSGPNCCGIRQRCIIWDHQVPGKSHATWPSICRTYRLGAALDWIGNLFG